MNAVRLWRLESAPRGAAGPVHSMPRESHSSKLPSVIYLSLCVAAVEERSPRRCAWRAQHRRTSRTGADAAAVASLAASNTPCRALRRESPRAARGRRCPGARPDAPVTCPRISWISDRGYSCCSPSTLLCPAIDVGHLLLAPRQRSRPRGVSGNSLHFGIRLEPAIPLNLSRHAFGVRPIAGEPLRGLTCVSRRSARLGTAPSPRFNWSNIARVKGASSRARSMRSL